MVDGQQTLALHGPRNMPIWGADYLAQAAGDYLDVPHDAEFYARNLIAAPLDEVARLLVK